MWKFRKSDVNFKLLKFGLTLVCIFFLTSCSLHNELNQTQETEETYTKSIDIVIADYTVILGETKLNEISNLFEDFDYSVSSGIHNDWKHTYKGAKEYTYVIETDGKEEGSTIKAIKIYYFDVVTSKFLPKGFNIKSYSLDSMELEYGPAVVSESMRDEYYWYLNDNSLRLTVKYFDGLQDLQYVDFRLVDTDTKV